MQLCPSFLLAKITLNSPTPLMKFCNVTNYKTSGFPDWIYQKWKKRWTLKFLQKLSIWTEDILPSLFGPMMNYNKGIYDMNTSYHSFLFFLFNSRLLHFSFHIQVLCKHFGFFDFWFSAKLLQFESKDGLLDIIHICVYSVWLLLPSDSIVSFQLK